MKNLNANLIKAMQKSFFAAFLLAMAFVNQTMGQACQGLGSSISITLPYNGAGLTTCGAGNDLTSSNTTACGSTSYLGGEDEVFIFTPTTSGLVTISLTSSSSWVGIMLYDGCPLNGQGGTCVNYAQGSAGNQSMQASVTAGTTYYLVVDTWPSPTCIPSFNLTITAPSAPPDCPGGLGSYVEITVPYQGTGLTNCGSNNDLTSSNVSEVCGATYYYNGEDEVYIFTVPTTGDYTIEFTSNSSYVGLMLYEGCPLLGQGGSCVGYAQGSSGNQTLIVELTAGLTYYLIVDSWASPDCHPSYSLAITASEPSNGCTNTTSYITFAAPTSSTPINPVSCTFAGEYNTMTNCIAGLTYKIEATGGTGNYLTVHETTPAGPVIAFGYSPVFATPTVNGNVYIHVNTNENCGTDFSCHALYVSLSLGSITDVTAGAQTACDLATNKYSQTLTITYETTLPGDLIVNGQSFPITGSPQTVVLTGLNSNGQPVDVSVYFSFDPATIYTFQDLFTAPEKCNLCKVKCPSDIFVNLAPGECNAYVNYTVSTDGDCGGEGIVDGFQGAFDPSEWVFSSVGTPFDGSVDASGAPASIILHGSNPGGCLGAGTVQTNYSTTITVSGNITFTYSYTTADISSTYDPFGYMVDGVWTPVTVSGSTAPQSGTVVVPVTVGQVFSFSQRSDNCFGSGHTTITNFSGPASNLLVPVQTAGLASGELYSIGKTTNCFEIPDGIGGTSSCCFDVNVIEFPNPTNTLVCNDLVQVSLDENCIAVLNADQILEGGPYGCYDNYVVNLHTPTGGILPGIVNGSHVGNGPHTVKVTDPKTGQSCWGKVLVKDKLPPIMECRDLTLQCNADVFDPSVLAPAPFFFEATEPIQFPESFVPHGGGLAYTLQGAGGPQGDYFSLTNNSAQAIQLLGFGFRTPIDAFSDPAFYNVYTRPGTFAGFELDPSAWTSQGSYVVGPWPPYFPTGSGPMADLTFNNPIDLDAGETIAFYLFSSNHGLVSNWTGGTIPPVTNGILTLEGGDESFAEFSNLFGVGNSIVNITVNYAIQSDPIPVWDNCDKELTVANGGLTYKDSFTPGSCGGPSGTYIRTWTAKDKYGNTVSCDQKITLKRPTLDNVELPSDIMWGCEQYNAYNNITGATALHPDILDADPATEILNVSPETPSYILANTGSGIPGIKGKPLVELCGISYEHTDLVVNVCAGTFKIVRKWTLIDWCADPVDVREYNQVIKVADATAPDINAPADLTIDVYAASTPTGGYHGCEGTFAVPPATSIGDDCSGVSAYKTELWTVVGGAAGQLLQSINSNGGVFSGVPMYVNGAPATYIIRYIATDGCGNQGYDDMKITLRDKVPPVAVCDEITEVSITNNGVGTGNSCSTLYAESLDDGSHDNCGPVYFLIAKMGDSPSPDIYNRCYYPSRNFCCEDLGDQTVIVLVLDRDPTPFFSNSFFPGCDGTPGLFLSQAFTAANYNACMVTVQVTDKLPPIRLTCPSDVRISCDEYADNLQTSLEGKTSAEQCQILTDKGYGEATYYDNCTVNVTCTVNMAVDQCLDGTITRTWKAKDAAGNSNQSQDCTQRIYVDHVSDWSVEFPENKMVVCETEVPDFGEPKVFNETCELIAISYQDEIFNVVPDACYKIVRTWTVINWCVVGSSVDQEVVELSEAQLWNQGVTTLADRDINGDGYFNASETNSNRSHRTFRDSWNNMADKKHKPVRADNVSNGPIVNPDTDPDSDPWDGYITYQQHIKIVDNVKPVFAEGCQIPDVCIYSNTCTETVVLPEPEVEDCSSDILLTAQMKIGGVWQTGWTFADVGPGTYEVRYNAKDRCNNQSDCNTTVTVKDCKKPTPYCKNGLVIEIDPPDPQITIWASDFNAGSFDNCPGELKISFSQNVNDVSRTYYCEHIGQQPVQIWVTDAAGNQDYCETFIIIQDNLGVCDDDPLVGGVTQTEGEEGVAGVTVSVNAANGSYNQSIQTGSTGVYSFAGVPSGGDYTLTPVLDSNPLNGVSTFDLVLISKHILGVQPLGSPYKIIAADANKSNSVTTFDLVEIRKMILFINTEFPNNTSWRFVDKGYVFPNPSNPFQTQFPEVINLNNLSGSQLSNDFVAVKVGDVNGSAVTQLLGGAEERTMVGDLVFNAEEVQMTAGESYRVDFKATDFQVSGYQFTLNYDRASLEFEEVGSGLADGSNFGLSLLEEGVITTSWNSDRVQELAPGEVVFSIVFKALQSGRMSEMLSISSRYTEAEAYTSQGELLNVGLSFDNKLVGSEFALYQNVPNPFSGVTTIGFYLPEATSAKLTISDVQGKVVKVIEGDYARGYNQVRLQRSELGATGVLYYRLDSGADTATRKMILVD